MVLYVTEQEMISRYLDSLGKAASRAKEMIQADLKDKPRIFTEFLNSIKIAAGSSHQLAHSQVDHSTKWLRIRDLLENILEIGQELPTFGGKEKNGLWFSIKQSLDVMATQGKKLYASKAMPKDVLDFELTERLKNAPSLSSKPF